MKQIHSPHLFYIRLQTVPKGDKGHKNYFIMFKIKFMYKGKNYSRDIEPKCQEWKEWPKELLWHHLGYHINSYLKEINVWDGKSEAVNITFEVDGKKHSYAEKLSGEIKIEYERDSE